MTRDGAKHSPATIAASEPAGDAWMTAMRRGDFATAWSIADDVLAARLVRGETCWHLPRHQQWLWTGAPLEGRHVLVHCYHGLGDTLQFVRFARALRRRAARVTLWVQPALLPLVATAPGVDAVIPLGDGAPGIARDVDIESMELSHALRIRPDRLADTVPYLVPPPLDPKLPPASGRRRIGFVWRAGGWDPARSVPTAAIAALFDRLAENDHIEAFSLQRGLPADETQNLRATDIGTDDVCLTAARMRALDLVVSVDTMAAHLAGALGVPCVTLLREACDWRWGEAGERTPWYPSMRLLRTPPGGGWADVITTLEQLLHAPIVRNPTETVPEQTSGGHVGQRHLPPCPSAHAHPRGRDRSDDIRTT